MAPRTESKMTTDHEEIRNWVEQHQGKPVRVRGTGNGNDPGILRFDFPGGAGTKEFEEISWDDWFTKFDTNNLALLYQVHKKTGEDSTFFKLVDRNKMNE